MFTNEELKNLAVLLQRVNLTGNEATAVAILQQKVGSLIKTDLVEPKSETPTSE